MTRPTPTTAERTAEADRLLLLSLGILRRGELIARSALYGIAADPRREHTANAIETNLNRIDRALGAIAEEIKTAAQA